MVVQSRISTAWGSALGSDNIGSMLVGPHQGGLQAVIPPAVRTLTPSGSPAPHSRDGWRHAVWRFHRTPVRSLGLYAPESLEVITFRRVVDITELADSEGAAWLARQIKTRISTLVRLLLHARADTDRLVTLRDELDELLLDAAVELGDEQVRGMLPEDRFAKLCTST